MDRLPSGGGMPGGAGADGAFERFLTAAIATIITIMFSWRLLGEEDEASGRNSGSVGARAIKNKSPHKHYGEESRSTVSPANRPNLSASSAGICDIDISDDEHNTHRSCEVSKSTLPDIDQPVEREIIVHDQQIPMYAQQQPRGGCEQPTSDENVSSVSIPDDNMTVDTLTSWDEYKWEEETGIEHDDVIVTRRTVRDFVSNRSPKSSYDHSDSGDNSLDHMSGVNVNIEVTNHNQSQSVPFSQRFANFEYKDTGGDSGYIDLYPDSDSDRMDSSDEEDEYEIQVSDSDSDEEDASAGSFYGVTTLDTIMEEIEMDASDDVIIAHDKRSSNRQDVDSAYISSICDEDDNTMETNKCDNSVQGVRDARAIECLANNNGVVCEQNNSPDFVNNSRVNGNDGSENSRVTATDFLTTENTMTQSVQNELHLKPNHANTVECNLTLENLPKSDMKNTSADLQQVCDMNINQTGTVSDYLALNEIRNATADPSVISNDKQVVNKITTIKVANSSYKPNKMKLKLTEDESKISDLSDDSLPPSPVRTCALDNLADAFSDTESCSSESVITVLSVKSNESESCNMDQYVFPANRSNKTVSPAGNTLPIFFDSSLVSGNKYDNFSLVSGFLNDSLNSLLSANTESQSDTESSSDRECTGQGGTDIDKAGEVLDSLNDIAISDESDISSIESLSVAQTDTEEKELNGHATSSDSIVNPRENQYDDNDNNAGDDDNQHGDEGNAGDEQIDVYDHAADDDCGSDGGYSDNSDPPLREYDPNDLTDFNLDSDDDSFFLVIDDHSRDVDSSSGDDEGKLRNFETFTNLNSVGLSQEYGDAVVSHALSEDARGFKFSHTENVSTEFKRRGYFTDRSYASDPDHLSPITSEDDEIKSAENEKNESLTCQSTHHKSPSAKSSSYEDAALSDPGKVEEGHYDDESCTRPNIDFSKYIINSDFSHIVENIPFPEDLDFVESLPTETRDLAPIDKDQLVTNIDPRSEIDNQGNNMDILGEEDVNNLESSNGQLDTVWSLTEQIESLTQSDIILGNEVGSGLNSVSEPRSHNATNNVRVSNIDEHAIVHSIISTEQIVKAKVKGCEDILSSESVINEDTQPIVTQGDIQRERFHGIKSLTPQARNARVETNFDVDIDNHHLPQFQPRKETNIDDVISICVTTTSFPSVEPCRHKAAPPKRETNIDDVFNDEYTDVDCSADNVVNITSSRVNDVKSARSREEKPLKYETFIDDLPNESVYSSSQGESRNSFTYESAIVSGLNRNSDRNPEKSQSRQEKCVHIDNSLVYEKQSNLKPTDTLNAKSVDYLKRDTDKQFTNTASNTAISSTDKPDDTDFFEKNEHGNTEQDNTLLRSNKKVDHISPIDSVTSNSRRDNYPISNTVTRKYNLENIDERIHPHVIANREVIIHEHNNACSDNGQLLQDNLQSIQPLSVLNNVDVPLPKTENLNSCINNSEIGQFPDRRYRDKHSHIPPEVRQLRADHDHSLENKYYNDNAGNTNARTNNVTLKRDAVDIHLTVANDDDNSVNSEVEEGLNSEGHSLSIGSCSLSGLSDDDSLNSLEESYNSLQENYTSRSRGQVTSPASSRIVRTPLTRPSDLYRPKSHSDVRSSVKRRINKQQLKKYTSILQQPVSGDFVPVVINLPDVQTPASRLKVQNARERFFSSENLTSPGESFEEKFLRHRTALMSSTPRKYLKRHERDLQSTESLPTETSLWNMSYGSNTSMENVHSLPLPSPRNFEELYRSRLNSANSSFERADHHKLHANCIFSPEKREEIRHTTKSLENMFEQLLRYGSVSSVNETDIDADVSYDVDAHAQSLHDAFVSFQYPLGRAASMSALVGANEAQRLPRKHGKGRFASRKVPKSKSLQTLETNLDDVFADELGQPGELQKTPSVHELRVSNSLSKLNVPDWFKKSSFSRSGSTQSLFTYAGRVGSTSTLGSTAYYPSMPSSPSPSVTPGSNAVIIQKRVTPNKTTPTSTRLLRAPMLPVTPERSPIHNTPPAVSLPSEKFRKTDSRKELKPITIVPFAKLREMFERKSQEDPNSPTVSTPTKEKPKVRFEEMCVTHETVVRSENQKPVQIERTISPPPPIPERKPIVSDNHGYGDAVNRKTQVHFSDESYVSKTQEQVNSRELNKANDRSQEHTNELNRQNGTTPSTNNKSSTSTGKKSGFRAALPQFRFRRPGSYVTKMTSSETESAQSKKGKDIDCLDGYYGEYTINKDTFDNTPPPTWLHALEYKAKIDGETLFEFLQKRRYSSILENGFAEQLDELQEKDAIFRFPVMTVNHHSINGSGPNMADNAGDLRVILTNVYNNRVQNGYVHSRLRGGAPIDDVLDGLLLLDGYSTGRMKVNENGRIVPRSAETPDTPPGLVFPYPVSAQIGKDGTLSENGDGEAIQSEYVLIRCEAPHCQRETNLKEARKYFKSCHSCFTYYCSRTCRKADWFAHKRMCVFSKLNSACKHVIKHINKQPHLQYQCSRIARRGYLSQGRGCVVFAFPDISSADEFLNFGMERLCVPPIYVPLKELPNAEMLGSKLEILSDTCKQYNPELKYVIHVAIVIPFQLPSRPVPRRMESIIQKCAKLRLSPAHMHPKQEHSDIPSTLILTAVPGNQHADDFDGRKTRELCFINIQRKLRNRGVSLRHKFPDVYNKLIDFVSDAKHFSPLIIYPMDSRTGRKFMCVIMPEAEPEIEWIRDPDLFHELGVFDDDEADGSTSNLSNHLQPEVML